MATIPLIKLYCYLALATAGVLFVLHTTYILCDSSTFPSYFKTKLIFYHINVNGDDESQKINEWFKNGIFQSKREVDEYYDSQRQLGKLVFRDTDGTIVELYARPLEGYYIIHRVGKGCSISKSRQEEFLMFEYLNKLLPDKPYLFGPSAIIYKWHHEMDNNEANRDNQPSVKNHRLIESAGDILYYQEPVGKVNPVDFIIRRSAIPIKRSQGISHYATRVLVREDGQFLQYAEFIAFDNVANADDLHKEDPFKLPTGIGCIPDDSSKLIKFDAGNRLSGHFVSSRDSLNRNFVAIDSKLGLLRHDIYDQSRNVLDLDRYLLYHMPYDVDPLANEVAEDQDVINPTSEHHVNRECFILSSASLYGKNVVDKKRDNAMQFLLTGSKNMYYMGRSYLRGSLVHVFESVLDDSQPLPFIFRLLYPRPIEYISLTETNFRMVNKIYITLYVNAIAGCEYYTEESAYPNDKTGRRSDKFYEKECDKQIPIAVRAVKHNKEINLYQLIDEISIFSASWRTQKSTENPLTIFDIAKCPLDRKDFSAVVTWADTKVATKKEQSKMLSLGEAVAETLRLYFHVSPIAVASVVQRTRLAYTAKVTMSLLECKMCHSAYRLMGTSASEISARLIRRKTGLTLLQCLMASSQYETVKSLLYTADDEGSSILGECLLYDKNDWSELDSSKSTDEDARGFKLRPDDGRGIFYDNKVYYLFFKIKECSINQYNSVELPNWALEGRKEETDTHGVLMKNYLVGDAILNDGQPVTNVKILSATLVNRQPETFTRILTGYRYDDEADYRFATKQTTQDDNNNNNNNNKVAMSLGYCENECENDNSCSSFAFCREDDENLCLISSIKDYTTSNSDTKKARSSLKMQLINGHKLQRDSKCEIHVKNYMEFFSLMRGTVDMSANTFKKNWKIYDNVDQANTCARNCLEIENDKTNGQQLGNTQVRNDCMLFLYCKRLQQCLVWLENPVNDTPYNDANLDDDSGDTDPELNLARKYNRFNCISFKYKNEYMYKPVKERLKDVVPIAISRISFAACSEKCAFEHQCKSFDTCKMELTKINDDNIVVYKRSATECRLYDVSIYDENANLWLTSDAIIQANDQFLDADQANELDLNGEKVISRSCEHFERRQAYNKGKRLSEINLDILESSNSMLSNAFSVLAAAFIGICLGIAIGTCTKKEKNNERYRGSISYVREEEPRPSQSPAN